MPELTSETDHQVNTVAPLPNFVGIGAQRAATTWLHECLHEHPEVFVPLRKELNYFVHNFELGVDWYRQQFAECRGEDAVGEITPTYLGDTAALPRIAATIPDARLFVVLRDPVDRAYSAYQLFRAKFRWNSFTEAIRNSDFLFVHGLYAENLRRAYDLFPADQIRIFLYDDIEADPRAVLTELYRYLDVDDSFTPPSLLKRYNRIVYPKAQRFLRTIGFGWAVSLVKQTPIAELVKNRANRKQRPCNDDAHYLRERYRSDIEDLQSLINRDLSHWLSAS